MKNHNGLVFQLVDLPPEGVHIVGEATAEELGIAPDEQFEFSAPFHYDLTLAPVGSSQDAYLKGSVSTRITANCDRCGKLASMDIAENDILHEYEKAMGKPLDLTDDVREDILLSLPLKFLCQEDCRGLCPHCGQNLNEGTCSCQELDQEISAEEQEENPWSQLDKLKL
ncbi:MAG: DUF177 domain-containing protein [Victivallales bacterium]|nr:DUF177 domain-containing protein [Victivallales bacterium]